MPSHQSYSDRPLFINCVLCLWVIDQRVRTGQLHCMSCDFCWSGIYPSRKSEPFKITGRASLSLSHSLSHTNTHIPVESCFAPFQLQTGIQKSPGSSSWYWYWYMVLIPWMKTRITKSLLWRISMKQVKFWDLNSSDTLVSFSSFLWKGIKVSMDAVSCLNWNAMKAQPSHCVKYNLGLKLV